MAKIEKTYNSVDEFITDFGNMSGDSPDDQLIDTITNDIIKIIIDDVCKKNPGLAISVKLIGIDNIVKLFNNDEFRKGLSEVAKAKYGVSTTNDNSNNNDINSDNIT